jgi:glycosyltransferase involved in cell wall biosynthesis
MVNALKFSAVSLYYSLTLNYDVIISSSGPITTAVPGLVAKFLRNKKFIFEVRDLWPTGAVELQLIRNQLLIKIGLWFEKFCYKNSDLVVACSKGMIAGVQKVFPHAKVLEVPNSSDTELFKRTDQIPVNFPLASAAGMCIVCVGQSPIWHCNRCTVPTSSRETPWTISQTSRSSQRSRLMKLPSPA